MKSSYYVLGIGYKVSDYEKKHPYEVWLDIDNADAPLVMLEGRGMGGIGGSFKPSDIIEPQWKEHLIISNTEWLIPLCIDAAQNRNMLDFKLVLETYNYLHNCSPTQVSK
ncbi:hypothetical protein SAMN05660691_03102 [Rheinheimera pacifica]|uniref:Uncharacterized protein n=1 Tax=Rheinheimera pacifica TaxID=173990 RepID=A0A1H6N0V0_9GAMM|nr:hypothetical protein [Rheinheimera pacifica]SEI04914.1 hypothetical protein SAMN05660691_03102 [Rheinheimera pacifica]